MIFFDRLFKKKIYEGEVVNLKESYRVDEETSYDGIPTVYYDIISNDTNSKVGSIDLRLTVEGFMYYYGHVGYNIIKKYRGSNYAYYACKVLFKIARDEFNINELIITCSPENKASYRILTKLGGEIVELVDVPSDHTLYRLGEKKKYIFRFDNSL